MAVSLTAAQEPGSTVTLADDPTTGVVRRTVLPGGLRIITEAVPGVRSVAVGVWAAVGSRDEAPHQAGCSHFLEHLLFKGTPTRDALAISAAIESRGGDINAFTGKESTCYYARVLDADLPVAVDVVMDLVLSSLIRADDVDAERDVILEEIAMHADEPSDAVHDVFSAVLFGDDPLGRPILGTVDSITGMARDTVDAYYRERYSAPRLVVAAADNLDHDTVVAGVRAALDNSGLSLDPAASPEPPRSGTAEALRTGTTVLARPVEQAHVVLGMPGVRATDDRRFALTVLNAGLGGGMSSRLFQEVREKRGLAYSVYSFTSQFADTGMAGVYAGCLPDKTDEVLAVCREELARVAAGGLSDLEVEQGKGQVSGSLVLRQEDTGSRMSRLGQAELTHGELLGLDEVLARVAAVTADDVAAIASEVFTAPEALAVVGPFDPDRSFSAGPA